MRTLKDSDKTEIHNHSYWLNTEGFIKNNPLQLNSINGLEDIANIISLYRIKSRLQIPCSHFFEKEKTRQLQKK